MSTAALLAKLRDTRALLRADSDCCDARPLLNRSDLDTLITALESVDAPPWHNEMNTHIAALEAENGRLLESVDRLTRERDGLIARALRDGGQRHAEIGTEAALVEADAAIAAAFSERDEARAIAISLAHANIEADHPPTPAEADALLAFDALPWARDEET